MTMLFLCVKTQMYVCMRECVYIYTRIYLYVCVYFTCQCMSQLGYGGLWK